MNLQTQKPSSASSKLHKIMAVFKNKKEYIFNPQNILMGFLLFPQQAETMISDALEKLLHSQRWVWTLVYFIPSWKFSWFSQQESAEIEMALLINFSVVYLCFHTQRLLDWISAGKCETFQSPQELYEYPPRDSNTVGLHKKPMEQVYGFVTWITPWYLEGKGLGGCNLGSFLM